MCNLGRAASTFPALAGAETRRRDGVGRSERGGQTRLAPAPFTGRGTGEVGRPRARAVGDGTPRRPGRVSGRHLLRLRSRWLSASRLPLVARFRKGCGINEAGGGLGRQWGRGVHGEVSGVGMGASRGRGGQTRAGRVGKSVFKTEIISSCSFQRRRRRRVGWYFHLNNFSWRTWDS